MPLPCELSPGEKLAENCLFVCYLPVGYENGSLSGYQSQAIQQPFPWGTMCVQVLSREILVTWRGLEGEGRRGVRGLPQSLEKFAASPQMPAKLEALTLAVFRVCRLSPFGKDWEMDVFACLCGDSHSECFFIHQQLLLYLLHLMSHMDASPIGGAVLLMGILKFGMLYVGSKLFAHQKEAECWGFSSDYMALCQGCSLYQECVLAFPIHVSGHFLISLMCGSHSSSF